MNEHPKMAERCPGRTTDPEMTLRSLLFGVLQRHPSIFIPRAVSSRLSYKYATISSTRRVHSSSKTTQYENELSTRALAHRAKVSRNSALGIGFFLMFSSLTFGFGMIPIWRLYCMEPGERLSSKKKESLKTMEPMMGRKIAVRFDVVVDPQLSWVLTPAQNAIMTRVGESALAFYKAKNISTEPIVGTSTYTVLPPSASPYFNKIQCFCFEEQLLEPGEEVDMPVFFYLDPDFAEDLDCARLRDVTLIYNFFKSAESDDLIKLMKTPIQEKQTQ